MMTREKLWLPLLITIFAFAAMVPGCRNGSMYDKFLQLDDKTWEAHDIKEFRVEIQDTMSPCNFFLNIRNTNDYHYSNLYLFIETRIPDGTSARDTVEVILAEPSGRWLGRGLGKVKENTVLLRTGLVFPRKGVYLFRLEQAMREEKLRGISDIGIRIEKMATSI